MRGHDDESGEFLGPSRSQRKREAEAVLELAERLVELGDARLRQLALPESIADAVRDTRRISAPVARKRQLHYLAKLMRREDEESLDGLRAALEHDRAEARRETAALHRVEAWRERLLADGDTALGELADAHPELDRQHLRALVRSAREERLQNRPPTAFREIFRVLKELGV
jgi:ribosome-associated protein